MRINLYKESEDKILYWQIWNRDERTVLIQTGELGKEGKITEQELDSFSATDEIEKLKSQGYEEPDSEYGWQWVFLDFGPSWWVDEEGEIVKVLDSKVEGIAKTVDNVLLRTGLGWVTAGCNNGDDIGISCLVYDCYLAREIIEREKEAGNVAEYQEIRISEWQK